MSSKFYQAKKLWIFFPESISKVSVNFKLEIIVFLNQRGLLVLIKSMNYSWS
jgi:hypothetical protein